MWENKYDDQAFFEKYSLMARSQKGLAGAGEWHKYKKGRREALFLGERVTKYHRILTTYLGTLLQTSFQITSMVEPAPPEDMMDISGMKDELRRPMMLLVSAVNQRHNCAQSQENAIFLKRLQKQPICGILGLRL